MKNLDKGKWYPGQRYPGHSTRCHRGMFRDRIDSPSWWEYTGKEGWNYDMRHYITQSITLIIAQHYIILNTYNCHYQLQGYSTKTVNSLWQWQLFVNEVTISTVPSDISCICVLSPLFIGTASKKKAEGLTFRRRPNLIHFHDYNVTESNYKHLVCCISI